jgi:hypothetical protein
MAAVRRPAGVSAADWLSLLNAVEEYREALDTHRADPAANAEPGMVAEDVANLCVRLLLPEASAPNPAGVDL